MELKLCSRCKKRPAVVFITKIVDGKAEQDGLCLSCAKDLGIKPVDDILKRMGITGEDLDRMNGEINGVLEMAEMNDPDDDDGGAPAVDLHKIFPGFPGAPKENKNKSSGNKKDSEKKFLSMYCTNLTEKAADGRIDRIIGRDREIERVIQILCRRQKNNPCLIGEPGVGKTAIAEALALRIVEGKVPQRLSECELWLLDLTALVAGTQFRGQFESRILGLIKEVKKAGNIILMIDEVHNIVGAGDSEGSMSAANMLKPALSRGEIQVIGATTMKEYRKYIEKDSALERRFQPIVVNEPSVEDTVSVIRGIKGYYETFHGVHVSDEIARFSAILSERYITDRFLPDKAIDLLDEAAARCALNCPELNESKKNEKQLEQLNAKLNELESKIEKPEEQTESNYKAIADLKVEIIRLEKRQEEISSTVSNLSLTLKDLASVVEIWTGIPASDIIAGELGELTDLKERISKKLIGQEEAVDAVVRAVRRRRAGVSYRKSPVSMIFAGPTGVGKTELVKVLANELFKRPDALIRLDMSEFMEKHAVSRIIGAPPGYVGYDEAGQLTEKIRRRPYSVILLDEIEKAHPDVMNILLQILDDGEITDAQGRQVNFENTVIIMTTNAGSEVSSAISGFGKQTKAGENERTMRALSEFLRPEFVNRIDEIITFRHLSEADFEAIAKLMLDEMILHLEEKDIKLGYSGDVPKKIAKGAYSEKFGARNMRRFIEREIEDPIANLIIDSEGKKIACISISVENDDFKFNAI